MKIKLYACLCLIIITFAGCSSKQIAGNNLNQNKNSAIDTIIKNQDNSQNNNSSNIGETNNNYKNQNTYEYKKVDIDLTKMSSDMVYSTIYQMMMNPTSYNSKTVKVKGIFDTSFFEQTNKRYYFVWVEDAASCCSQGIEFVWNDDKMTYPDDYPELGKEIVVTGKFETYMEGSDLYCHLNKARME